MPGLPPILFADLSRHREGMNMCINCRNRASEWVFEPFCSQACNDEYKTKKQAAVATTRLRLNSAANRKK